MSISERINRISYSPTMKIAAEVKLLIDKGENIIDLTVGEPDFPTPQNIKEAAFRAINNNFTKYTANAGIVELRRAISTKLKNENNINYNENEIIVGSGAKQCIFNSIQAIIDDGDEVVFSSPYYVSYPQMVSIAGGNSIIIKTTEDSDFKILPEQLRSVITSKTKLLILCNPTNPTGTVYTKDELIELTKIIDGKDIYILADEIYEKIVYDDFKFCSVASISPTVKEKTITINGCSKSYSMTGWRLGYVAAPENIATAINIYQSHSSGNTSSISQAAALEAIIGPQDSVIISQKEFEKRRNYFYSELTSVKGLTCYKPKGAFYFFPNIKNFIGKSFESFLIKDSVDFSTFLLRYGKVGTVPGIGFGAEDYIRISYSTSMNNLIEAAARIQKTISLLSK